MNTHVIIILGQKPEPERSMNLHPEFKDRIERAVEIVRSSSEYTTHVLVISGGQTVSGLPSEAEIAEPYLRGELLKNGLTALVLLEEKSRTTPENIVYSQLLLAEESIVPTRITVIGRMSQIPKTRVIMKRIWLLCALKNVEYISGIDTSPLWHQLIDLTVMKVVSFIDPCDRFILSSFKRRFRNWHG